MGNLTTRWCPFRVQLGIHSLESHLHSAKQLFNIAASDSWKVLRFWDSRTDRHLFISLLKDFWKRCLKTCNLQLQFKRRSTSHGCFKFHISDIMDKLLHTPLSYAAARYAACIIIKHQGLPEEVFCLIFMDLLRISRKLSCSVMFNGEWSALIRTRRTYQGPANTSIFWFVLNIVVLS